MSLKDALTALFTAAPPKKAPGQSSLSYALRGRYNSATPQIDTSMFMDAPDISTLDNGGGPQVTDGELKQQLWANYFSLPSDQRDISSPAMQAIKNQIMANRMQLGWQTAKSKNRKIDI